MALTHKQRLFVDHYLQCWNATEAALLAGYSEKSARQTGSENLSKPYIAEAIKQRLVDNAMSAEEVLSRMSDIARGDIGDFLHPESLSIDIRAGNTKLIKKVKYVVYTTDDDQTETVEFELYSALDALKQLAKVHSLVNNKLVIEDWRTEVIADIKAGKIDYRTLTEVFNDHDLATELFRSAGVPTTSTMESV